MFQKNIITLLLLLFTLSACAVEKSTPSLIINQNTVISSSTPKSTRTQSPFPTFTLTTISITTPKPPMRALEPTLTNTATSFPLIEAPAGITFWTKNGLYVTEKLGKKRLLLELSNPELPFFSPDISPDGSFVLLSTFENQSIYNLKTAEKTPIWPKSGYNLCPFYWINTRPLYLITVILPEGSDPGYSCNHGSPVLLSLDGKTTVFDKEGSGLSAPDVSPDGKFIAYDLGGKPIIFNWQGGSQPFEVTSYGFPRFGKVAFTDPSWSPSAGKLAWTYGTIDTPEETAQQGIAIFNLKTKTSKLFAPYDIVDYEGSRPYISWNGDETYIAVWHFQEAQRYEFVWELLSVDGNTARTLDGRFGRWSPNSNLFTISKYQIPEGKWQLFIESPDGSTSYSICCGSETFWSPDGKQLLSGAGMQEYYLTDLDTRTTRQINLPPASVVVGWEEIR